jgi:hypothetical protein
MTPPGSPSMGRVVPRTSTTINVPATPTRNVSERDHASPPPRRRRFVLAPSTPESQPVSPTMGEYYIYPTTPSYTYVPDSPTYLPDSPSYVMTSPSYSPTSPSHNPMLPETYIHSPTYAPTSRIDIPLLTPPYVPLSAPYTQTSRSGIPPLSIGATTMPTAIGVEKGSMKSIQDMLTLKKLQHRHADSVSVPIVDVLSLSRSRDSELSDIESDGGDEIRQDCTSVIKGSYSFSDSTDLTPLRKKFKASANRYANIVKDLKKRVKDNDSKHDTTGRVVKDLSKKVDSYRKDFDSVIKIHANQIYDMTTSIDKAVKKAETSAKLSSDLRYKELESVMAAKVQEYEDKFRKIKVASNELRYVQKFNASSSRGAPFCVFDQEVILDMEPVVALVSDCDCNFLVRASYGLPYLNKQELKQEIDCPKCRAVVHKVVITTVMQSEHNFAWRKMESLVQCDTDEEIIEKRVRDLKKLVTDQTAQDTAPLRAKIASIFAITND